MNSHTNVQRRVRSISFAGFLLTIMLAGASLVQAQEPIQEEETGTIIAPSCARTIKADVVAFDQPFFYNRLGAVNPAGMIYALRRDVEAKSSAGLVPGNVRLKKYKRARPLVLRMNVGDCIQILFQNLLDPNRADDNQPATRTASIHGVGLNLKNSILDDGSNVGKNPSSLVAPGGSITYNLYAEKEGNHLLYSTAATTGGEGDGGSLPMGLFGSINVEAKGAEWYRSQVTELDMRLAQKKNADGTLMTTAGGHPILNYDAVYPTGSTRPAGTPILKMLDANNNIVHSDLNAIITGPGRAPVTAVRHQAIRFSTVTSIRTSRWACGNSFAYTTCSRQERSSTLLVDQQRRRASCPMPRLLPALPFLL